MSEEKQDPKNRPFVERFLDLNEEMVEVHVPKFYEKLSDEMDSVIQGKIDEIIKVVARSFGAQKSELPFLIRKMSWKKRITAGKRLRLRIDLRRVVQTAQANLTGSKMN